jgi:EF-hand domain-containing family member B
VDLLFPSTFTEMGISEYDFQLPRTRDDIKSLFERIGFSYKVGKFNAMYNRAKELMTGASQTAATALGGDTVSVRAFMQAVRELHSIE